MNVKELRENLMRWRATPEQARKGIQDSIDLLGTLMTATSDSERIRVFNRFKKRFTGYGSLENLLYWSSLANPSPAVLAGQRRIERERQKEMRRRERYIEDVSRILQKGTGLDRKLCREIMAARYWNRKMRKAWPVTEGPDPNWKGETIYVVIGPKGEMPLSGDGCPHYIYDEQRGQVT